MLFHTVGPVQAPMACAMPDTTTIKQQQRRLGEFRVTNEQAEAACASAAEKDFKNCVFDVLATNNIDATGSYVGW